MAMHDIEIDDKRLREICRDFSVRRLALFGSFQRGDFSDESDVDILVEFEAGARVGLAFFALQDELSQLSNLRGPRTFGQPSRQQARAVMGVRIRPAGCGRRVK